MRNEQRLPPFGADKSHASIASHEKGRRDSRYQPKQRAASRRRTRVHRRHATVRHAAPRIAPLGCTHGRLIGLFRAALCRRLVTMLRDDAACSDRADSGSTALDNWHRYGQREIERLGREVSTRRHWTLRTVVRRYETYRRRIYDTRGYEITTPEISRLRLRRTWRLQGRLHDSHQIRSAYRATPPRQNRKTAMPTPRRRRQSAPPATRRGAAQPTRRLCRPRRGESR